MSCIVHNWNSIVDFSSDGMRKERCATCGDTRWKEQKLYSFDAKFACGQEVTMTGMQRTAPLRPGDKIACKAHGHETTITSLDPRGDGKVAPSDPDSNGDASDHSVGGAIFLILCSIPFFAIFVWSMDWPTFFTFTVGIPSAVIAASCIGAIFTLGNSETKDS